MPASLTFDDHSLNNSQLSYLPDALLNDVAQTWTLSGEGVMSWTVFKLYRARLFVAGDYYDPAQHFVLDLTYLRNLTAEMIVSASIDELNRLRQPDAELLKKWTDSLMQIVPDVGLDDRLIGCFTPQQGVRFYDATGFLGEIVDARFAESFAAIWLDPQTRSSSLRQALLGENPARPQTGDRVGV